jgi:hypothetical protein
MLESYVMNTSNPEVLKIKKTKVTRAMWTIIVFLLMAWMLSPVYQSFSWQQLKDLISLNLQIIDSLKLNRLYPLPWAVKAILAPSAAIFAIICVFLFILLWMIKNMFKEKIFSFDSTKREITKNGRMIAKFDDIEIVKITNSSSFHNLSLIFKNKEGVFPNKINFGLFFTSKEAAEIGSKIAETIGVNVIHKRFFSKKVLQ